MLGSERAPQPDPKRQERARAGMALFWIVWAVWLVARPVETRDVDPQARTFIAFIGFAFLLAVGWGLTRAWRWSVMASRALVGTLIIGVIVGPAGRDPWIFGLDIAFAVAGSVIAFGLIRMGPAPPPKGPSERMMRRAEERRRMIERYRKR